MSITLESIEKLQQSLRELPVVEDKSRELNKQEAVALLVDEVEGLKKKGYSLEQIAGLLTEGGFAIKPPTLKSYLSRARGVRKSKRLVKKPVARSGTDQKAEKKASSVGAKAPKADNENTEKRNAPVKAQVNPDNSAGRGSGVTVSPGSFVPKPDSPDI